MFCKAVTTATEPDNLHSLQAHINNSSSTPRKRPRHTINDNIRLFSFNSFGDPGCPCDYDGAFRDNIRAFLQSVAERSEFCHSDIVVNEGARGHGSPLAAWSISLQEETHNALLPLLILEEDVQTTSRLPYCDHCRSVGWSQHLLSKRRYHFIIPSPELNVESLQGNAASNILDLPSHLLHGVLHCNGYGHLLCVNGRERGSQYVSGREIMDLWDRICAMLRARKVSVADVAKKRSLEFRLLHCVAYGESWFGRWGYKFSHDSFGAGMSMINRQQMYAKAIEAIRGMPLNVMVQHFEGIDQDVIAIASMYQRISGHALQTVGDLIRYMMELKVRLPLHPSTLTAGSRLNSTVAQYTAGSAVRSYPNVSFGHHHHHAHQHHDQGSSRGSSPNNGNLIQYYMSTINHCSNSSGGSGSSSSNLQNHSFGMIGAHDMPCRWSVKRLELATQVIVEALKNCEKKWMPRQDVRDAARIYIGDTGLLDFVLKSLGNRVVGSHVVRRAVNPITKVLEYSLEDAGSGVASTKAGPHLVTSNDAAAAACEVGRADVLRDILYLYANLLESYKPARKSSKSVLLAIPTATRIILDTKLLVKDYRGEVTRKCAANVEWAMDDDEMLRVMCNLQIIQPHPRLDATARAADFGQAISGASEHHPQQQQLGSAECHAMHRMENYMLEEGGLLDDVLDVLLSSSSSCCCSTATTATCTTTAMSSSLTSTSCSAVQGAGAPGDIMNASSSRMGVVLQQGSGGGGGMLSPSKASCLSNMIDDHVLMQQVLSKSAGPGSCGASWSGSGCHSTSSCSRSSGDGQYDNCSSMKKLTKDAVVVVQQMGDVAELIVLPPHATVGELKREAERAFRDTYCAMSKFELKGIRTLEGVEDDDLLFGNIESGSRVTVYGTGLVDQDAARGAGTSKHRMVMRYEAGVAADERLDTDGQSAAVLCNMCPSSSSSSSATHGATTTCGHLIIQSHHHHHQQQQQQQQQQQKQPPSCSSVATFIV